jgi:hypothetical protein
VIQILGLGTPGLTLPHRALQTLSRGFAFIRGDGWRR